MRGGLGTRPVRAVFSDECYAGSPGRPAPVGVAARLRRRGRGALPLRALEPGRGPGRPLCRGSAAGSSSSGLCASTSVSWSSVRPRSLQRRPRRTDDHVEVQPERYRERLGLPGRRPRWLWPPGDVALGRFRSGCPRPPAVGATLARWPRRSASDGGLRASLGDLYGEGGAGHVRVAVVQPDRTVGAGGGAPRRSSPERQATWRRGSVFHGSTTPLLAARPGSSSFAAPVGVGELDGRAKVRP